MFHHPHCLFYMGWKGTLDFYHSNNKTQGWEVNKRDVVGPNAEMVNYLELVVSMRSLLDLPQVSLNTFRSTLSPL